MSAPVQDAPKGGGVGKKIALGCLGVVLLLALAGGIIVYRFVMPGVRTARALVQLEELNANVRNQQAFNPDSPLLSDTQLTRFLAVQEEMFSELEGDFAQIEARYQDIDDNNQAGLRDVMNAWSDLAGLLVSAKRSQVDALNAQDFSLAEYAWVRQRIYEAIGYSTVSAVQGAEGVNVQIPEDIPQANIDMVTPHQETLIRTLPLTAVGL
ncbi:MAG: hypothetical protein AAF267_12295 [Deinococcota bacterium]